MENETPLDPFAVDFFGVRPRVETAEPTHEIESSAPGNSPKPKQKKRLDWFALLPKFSRDDVESSNTLQSFPARLTEIVTRSFSRKLAHYIFAEPSKVKCSIISVSEVNLRKAVGQLAKTPQIFSIFGCQMPVKSAGCVAFDTALASSIISLVLGVKDCEPETNKQISEIEKTIIEFLTINIFSEINEQANQTLFCLQSVEDKAPKDFKAAERGAEMVFRIETGAISGIITMLATGNFIQTFQRQAGMSLQKNQTEQQIRRLEKIAPKVNLNLLAGTTKLDADHLLFLEPEDIILIENPNFQRLSIDPSAMHQVFVGGGTNVRLTGNFIAESVEDKLNFRIKEFISEEKRRGVPFAKFTMDVNENEEVENEQPSADPQMSGDENAEDNTEEQNLTALENVQVSLRVEMAGGKVSLRELKDFRAGQIIALGCRPTDPVQLFTDDRNQPIATGELVEIEGQIGVRLTKIFI